MNEEDIDPLSLELRDRPEVRLNDLLTPAQVREVAAEFGIRDSGTTQLDNALRDIRQPRR